MNEVEDPRRFSQSLARGLGRCVLHLRAVADVTPYREALLDAFHFARGYDPQCEGPRAQYVFDLAEAGHLEEELRAAALDGLTQTEVGARPEGGRPTASRWDLDQHVAVIVRFAARGDRDLADALCARFLSVALDSAEFDSLAWTVPVLRGLDGFLMVAGRMGAGPDEGTFRDDCAIRRSDAEEAFGADQVSAALLSAAASDALVANFLRYSDTSRAEDLASPSTEPQRPLASLLQSARVNGETSRPWLAARRWGRRASPDELLWAADRLGATDDAWEVRMLLGVFSRITWPGPREVLLRLVRSADADLQRQAIEVLAAQKGSDVRDEGLRLVSAAEPVWDGLRLFALNYQPGDGAVIASLLSKAPVDDHELVHRLGLALLEALLGSDRAQDVVAPLRWLYEHTPCGSCRRHAVEALIGHNALDADAIAECAWDANEDIRALVRMEQR